MYTGPSGSRQQGLIFPRKTQELTAGLTLATGLSKGLTRAVGMRRCELCSVTPSLCRCLCPVLARPRHMTSPVGLGEYSFPGLGHVSGKGTEEIGQSPLKFHEPSLAPKAKITWAFRVSFWRKASDAHGLTSPSTRSGPARGPGSYPGSLSFSALLYPKPRADAFTGPLPHSPSLLCI